MVTPISRWRPSLNVFTLSFQDDRHLEMPMPMDSDVCPHLKMVGKLKKELDPHLKMASHLKVWSNRESISRFKMPAMYASCLR